ncbi:MAG: DUF2782 domain-containing protein [Gammaproteobacteria bacterium]|nr:DUF2782 domain-containing protein [Gammaproteobacteria bacterium]
MRAFNPIIVIVFISAMALSATAAAQDNPILEPALEPPPLPSQVQDGEALEPDVTITHGEKETVAEYRLNGHLYMIRVTPKTGYTYYLVDGDGDGNLETRHNELAPGFMVPNWVLLSW